MVPKRLEATYIDPLSTYSSRAWNIELLAWNYIFSSNEAHPTKIDSIKEIFLSIDTTSTDINKKVVEDMLEAEIIDIFINMEVYIPSCVWPMTKQSNLIQKYGGYHKVPDSSSGFRELLVTLKDQQITSIFLLKQPI